VKHNKKIAIQMKNAAKFHGHLGPFLVIGVRMGQIAKKQLDVKDKNTLELHANIRTRLIPPFSCVIDGIQVATGCTIGNQKLKIEESSEEMTASFKLQGSNKTVKILVNSGVVRNLTEKMSSGVDAELLTAQIAHMKEEQLFLVEKQY